MENYDPKAFLLFALNHFEIEVIKQDGKMIHLRQEYVIEIEGQQLFKLLQANQVIAPFSDVEELCQFIKMDMQD
ncbi:MAG: hypothetical protein AAGG68_12595 [Bacteroidota bacterium]